MEENYFTSLVTLITIIGIVYFCLSFFKTFYNGLKYNRKLMENKEITPNMLIGLKKIIKIRIITIDVLMIIYMGTITYYNTIENHFMNVLFNVESYFVTELFYFIALQISLWVAIITTSKGITMIKTIKNLLKNK